MPSNRRGGGWTQSLLPSSSKSHHQTRNSCKRTALINFLFTNFFTIVLSISLLFFLLTLFLFGIPKPIFSSHVSRSITTRRLPARKPVTRKKPGSNPNQNGAVVDITTKQLYDKIEFLDKAGGNWTQGWQVSYKGNEWDTEKLKVIVVPRSHNDPGWKFTVEEYYEAQSRHILDTIVETLSKDHRRKFIWEEMSYLERWWRDASEDKRESFTNLVKDGQLEIVGGGWVMNDEVFRHAYNIIQQFMQSGVGA